jgi:hypothetical protein
MLKPVEYSQLYIGMASIVLVFRFIQKGLNNFKKEGSADPSFVG